MFQAKRRMIIFIVSNQTLAGPNLLSQPVCGPFGSTLATYKGSTRGSVGQILLLSLPSPEP